MKMPVTGDFEIIVEGKIKDPEQMRKFISEMAKKVSRVDYNFKLEEIVFAQLNVRFIWTGIPKEFIYFDEIWVYIKQQAYRSIANCRFSIKINYIETE